jgi:gas vesicle structural protein
VSVVGIEVLTIDARIVVASVDTYLRFAEAADRLDLTGQATGLPEIISEATERTMEEGAKRKVKGAIERPVEAARENVEAVKEKLPGVG